MSVPAKIRVQMPDHPTPAQAWAVRFGGVGLGQLDGQWVAVIGHRNPDRPAEHFLEATKVMMPMADAVLLRDALDAIIKEHVARVTGSN